jgi:hypothetical protein
LTSKPRRPRTSAPSRALNARYRNGKATPAILPASPRRPRHDYVTALGLLATAGEQPAHAAICADYPNQAAAQHAADTRDGDGVYCESLP